MAIDCLEFLQANLEQDNAQVRVLAFTGIVLATECFPIEAEFFTKWCDDKLSQLFDLVGVKFDQQTKQQRLDLLYVVVALNHVDPDVFKNEKTSAVWPRELLIGNLFKQLSFRLETEQLEFYQLWLQIEEKKKQPIASIVLLIHLNLNISIFESISDLNEVLFVLTQYEASDSMRLDELNIDEMCVFLRWGLKQNWCLGMIEKSMRNLASFDRMFLEQLAQRVCSQFNAQFIHRLFNSITVIDDFKAFESLLEFCSSTRDQQKKSMDDLWLRNFRCSTVTEFRSVLQVKHLCDHFASMWANQEQMGIMFGVLLDLLNKKEDRWTFEQLGELIQAIKERHQQPVKRSGEVAQLTIDLLRVISHYELSSLKHAECLEIFQKADPLENLSVLVISNKFNQKVTFFTFIFVFLIQFRFSSFV